ncbi:SpoIIE family protein phosphatase [Vallicoccus soli]|uniref:SpoIIE family protein phosphatase n=1 Tax=Vallicoccus soli TaxID=2339232 RepID=UPI0014034485|nr:SpoIIE family protein phosphatase [Vallicoccus soli]
MSGAGGGAADGGAPVGGAPAPGRDALLAAALDRLPVGVVVLDADLRVLAASAGVPAPGAAPPWLEGQRGRLLEVLRTGEPLEPGGAAPLRARRLRAADGRALVGVLVDPPGGPRERPGRGRPDVLALLDEAARRVGSTLDVATTAREVVQVAVPAFADLAAVDLLEEQGPPGARPRLRRVARAAADPAPAGPYAAAGAPPVDDGGLVARVLEGREPVLVADPGAPAPGPPGGPPGEGPGPLVLAPLVARGAVLGLVTLGRGAGASAFDAQDLRLAGELARRAALAVDNARLYSRERATAVELQRSLLPREDPELGRVAVAHRYLPGGTTQVGGDWFDVIALAGGRVALVVGDVMGRGLRAAAAMGQLRTAVRTLAVLDLMPEDVLAHLDDLAQSLDEVQLATCAYAVYDPVDRALRYATAGHLPPVLLDPSGAPRVLAPASGAPLGVGGVPFGSVVVDVPDGCRLVLCTDGLVESRGADVDDGTARLLEALRRGPDDLEALCDAVLAETGRDRGHDDDVALLVARLEGVDPASCTAVAVRADLAAVGRARRLARRRLEEWGLHRLVDTAELLVSELVTNAVRYAREPVVLRLLLLDDRVEVSVADSDARLPRLRRAAPDDEGGRGLHLVGSLARRWGARSTPGGKVVWFDLPLR